MKIGYDFDGVFHKSVGETDTLGERNYIDGENIIPFFVILDRVKKEIGAGHEVFIISRNDKEIVLKNLKKLAIDMLFKDENIICDLGKKNISKSEIIKEKKIDVFFDDSVFNIHQINRDKKKKKLNTQLYLVNPVLEEYKRIKSNNLKMLTYNVNWQNMSGDKSAPIDLCKTKDLCASNINNLILDELPLDFIFIQEVMNEEVLFKDLEKEYKIVKTKSGNETMGVVINNKYNVLTAIGGEFESGRPFLVVFLKEGICLVNVHMGHKKNILDELKKIEEEIYKRKINVDPYRIILGGDFNADVGKEILFFEKNMFNYKKKFTCCVYTTHMGKSINNLRYLKGKNIDHILDSEDEPVYSTILTPLDENNNLNPGSDHLGVYVELLA